MGVYLDSPTLWLSIESEYTFLYVVSGWGVYHNETKATRLHTYQRADA